MGLISEYIEVGLSSNTIKYYESLGYEIPRYKNQRGKMVVKRGTKIKIKVADIPKQSTVKVLVKCDCCNKEYYTEYFNYTNQNHNGKSYCHKCSLRVLNSGENHYKWKIDKTNEEREQGRYYIEYTEFIKKVLKRDNYTCRICEKTNTTELEVHHLDGYDWCKEKRVDETNGICLCENCHKNFHSIYGYGNNTKKQFEEWIGHAIKVLKYEGELSTTRQIYCIEEDKVYNSAEELSKEWGIKSSIQIYNVCNHKISLSGSLSKTLTKDKKHIFWLDEWKEIEKDIKHNILIGKISIDKYLDNKYNSNKKENRKIYCVEENRVYNDYNEIIKKWKLNNNVHVYNVCNHKIRKRKHKGKNGVEIVQFDMRKTLIDNSTTTNKHIFWLDEWENIKQDIKQGVYTIDEYLDSIKENKLNEIDIQ